MGYGVVGSGVAEVLITNAKHIESKIGQPIEISKILDLRDFDNDPLKDKFTKNFEDILNDSEIGVVAEVMGGITPAFDYVMALLKAGKSVVTSNKELVAAKGAELLKTAKEKNVNFLFEASVGGGIPVLRPLHQCLASNKIIEICGILNGTTNYILTKMINENRSLEDVLKEAQDLGYAERNPAADIEGHDACRKICILASLAFSKHVYPDSVHTEGITSITLNDVNLAQKAGYVIKLIGKAKMHSDNTLYILVAPMLIENSCPLACVSDVFNAVMVEGNAVGDVMFYGRGAGKLPTASAVVADMIDCVKHVNARKELFWQDSDNSFVSDIKEENVRMYVRICPEGLQKVMEIFPDAKTIQIENDFAFITSEMKEKQIDEGLEKLKAYGFEAINKIRLK
ncbi:MAG: homoserine dehydrogenase [Ruminococcaceae bacterium]|nr:homoserine dehydrogenase [Oscillospiraceae bacterium]